MRLQRERPETPDVNLTPLIDVVFLLLIFFMVSTTFQRASELTIELPKASNEQKSSDEDVLEVSIDAQGRHYVGGHRLVNTQPITIRQALHQAAGRRANPQVLINADRAAPYQAIITVMDAAQRLGYTRLSFAHQQLEQTR